ncbi:MAG: efflux RND transporter periplasmic adaptor subunit [Ruminococcus sp.]|nr:efflux RND transporter periplasmic adaptor subunit [Ruminococcus sp.]
MSFGRVLALVCAGVLCVGLCSCGEKKEEKQIDVPILETKQISYKTVKAEISNISEKYYETGKYSYPYSESVKFKATGLIKEIYVQAPSDVKKGDLLCELYTDDVDEEIEREKIRLDQAEQTLATVRANSNNANEIRMAELDLQIEQMKYDRLVQSLEDYKVYAPCDGTFTDIYQRREPLTVNSPVREGDLFGLTSDLSQQYLCVSVYDNPLNNVNFGTRVSLEQGAHSAQGTVKDIIPVDNGDFSNYVYVILPDEDSELFDFGDVKVVFDVYTRPDTVVVDQKAVRELGGRKFVNLLIDGAKIEQDVETGIEDGKNIEILSGLVGGEEIILN